MDDKFEDDEIVDFELDKKSNIIKVLGVGGGGGNAVNHMFKYGIHDVDFIVANTDQQALAKSSVPVKIQLGATLTEGLGAGNNPAHGEAAAVESIDEITKVLGGVENTKMLFVTAGMGGGTGTGAAPVIAKTAKEAGILTVAIVTVPFRFEGPKRVTQAIAGLEKLKANVDSLLVIDNEKILEQYADEEVDDAFGFADDVLTMAAKGIAEIITVTGHVNVDFADVKTVLKDSGIALMGTGIAEGQNRALTAIQSALNSPLLSNNDIHGAKNILINVFSSSESKLTLGEVAEINNYIQQKAGCKADLIWGKSTDDTLGKRINVTLIASGFESSAIQNPFAEGGTYNNPIIVVSNKSEEEQAAEAAAEQKEASEESEIVAAGEQVDLPLDPDDSEDIEETEEEDEGAKMLAQNKSFQPIDYSKVDVDEYDKVPAYVRKGVTLNIGNYSGKCQKISLSNDNGV
jgi:cell division protein FtsZ